VRPGNDRVHVDAYRSRRRPGARRAERAGLATLRTRAVAEPARGSLAEPVSVRIDDAEPLADEHLCPELRHFERRRPERRGAERNDLRIGDRVRGSVGFHLIWWVDPIVHSKQHIDRAC
jgi:hypothetical protein